MANFINEKLNQVFQLLSKNKFTTANDISDDYKCSICKNIINNAHQTICGCNFCLECINKLIDDGGNKCPGNTDECKLGNLSNIVTNHRLNIAVSKIIAKCSKENCSYECKLVEMEDHFRFCSMKCPFNDIGCEDEVCKLNEHLIANVENHSKLMIEFIDHLRNDVKELKDSDARNRSEIEILKANDKMKDETIQSLRNDIKSLKKENQELKSFIRASNNNFRTKLNELDINLNERCKNDSLSLITNEIELMRIDKSNILEQIKLIDRNCQDLNEKIKERHQENEEKNKMNFEINTINKFLKMRHHGELRWQIGKINDIKWMASDYFYDRQNPYQMQLRLNNANDKLNIRLRIHSNKFDPGLKWPVQAKIIIHIYSFNEIGLYQSMTKSCTIRKPEINSVESSQVISFTFADLKQADLFDITSELVCNVKFE